MMYRSELHTALEEVYGRRDGESDGDGDWRKFVMFNNHISSGLQRASI